MDEALELGLLEAIARDPEDPAPYLVYADWLQAHDKLRGELVTLQGTSDERPGDHRISDAALDHLRKHADYYLGPLADVLGSRYLELGWRCGFIGSAELQVWPKRPDRWSPPPPDFAPAQLLAKLLDLDSARFLTRLVVEPMRTDLRFVAQVLAARARDTLRTLWVGARTIWSNDRGRSLGDFAEVWQRIPHLVELVLVGHVERVGELELPQLRCATIRLPADGDHATTLRDVARARWPRLETLHVWNGHSIAAVEELLARDDLVTLGDVGILNCWFADDVCAALARSPLAPQLNRISLARGALTDAGASTLLGYRAAFPSLVTLDVSHTQVSRAVVEQLRELAPNVLAHELRTGRPAIEVGSVPVGQLDDDD